MQEGISLLSNTIKEVKGLVGVDYLDPVTGKVKEQIKSKNLVFSEVFNSLAWWDILNLTNNDTLFITDDNTPPDPTFAYLPGNIIGWGRINADASGAYRGQWNAGLSYRNVLSEGGRKVSWRYVYDYSPSQIAAPIGSIGITTQYMAFNTSNVPIFPVRRQPYVRDTNSHFFKGGQGYRISNSGIITVYDPLMNSTREINVSSITGTASTLSLGFDTENGKGYVLAYHSTAANRRMYEFSDETFSVLLNTHSFSNVSTSPSSRIFVVYGDHYYYWNNSWYQGDFVNNVMAVAQPTASCPYNTSGGPSNNVGLIAKGNRVFPLHEWYSGANKYPVWDVEENKQIATINPVSSSNSSFYGALQCIEDSNMPNKPFLLSHSQTGFFMYKQALTHWAVPDGAVARPDDSGVKISYDIEVSY